MRPLVLCLVLLAAGCVTPASQTESSGEQGTEPIPTFAQDHDHTDPSPHAASEGLYLLGAHDLASPDVPRGDWITSEIIVRGDHAYVGYVGAPWLVGIVDITDASAPDVVGRWATANAWAVDLTVSDDGDWVYVAIYPHAVGTVFDPEYLLTHVGVPDGPALPGVAIVDARDRTAPKFAGFLPIHELGPHTVAYHRYPDGQEYLFIQKASLNEANLVEIARVVATPTGSRALQPVATYWLDEPIVNRQPHDVDVQEHPITGQTLLYIAYTFNGLVIVDVSDPASPSFVSRTLEGSESDPDALLHDVHPYPELVDGRHFTFIAPEIITGATSGSLRILDTTDPAAPFLVGSWQMPGEYVTDEPFSFTPHNFQFMPDGKVALAHGHAGVWLIDWLTTRGAAPTATAYHAAAQPGAAPPSWSPVTGTPWYWGTAVDARGTLWASDSMGGIVSLAEE